MTPKPGGRLELAAYFFDPSVDSWKLMAAMEVERTVGWNGIYSFLEQWTGAEPEAKRWGLYGPAFAKPTNGRTWEQVTSVAWRHGNAKKGQDGKPERTHQLQCRVFDNRFSMSMGGDAHTTRGRATLSVRSESKCDAAMGAIDAADRRGDLPTGVPVIQWVSCGNHEEKSCAACPRGTTKAGSVAEGTSRTTAAQAARKVTAPGGAT